MYSVKVHKILAALLVFSASCKNSKTAFSGTRASIPDTPLQIDAVKYAEMEDKTQGGIQPTVIHFALDVTASMDGPLDTIKANILDFAKALQAKGVELKLSAVAFEDEIIDEFNSSNDFSAFQKFISKQVADGGGDGEEAGILALAKIIMETEKDPNHMHIVLMITDIASHDGKGGFLERNCNTDILQRAINSFSDDNQKRFRFYYSVPEEEPEALEFSSCTVPQSAAQQYGNFLKNILPKVEESKRGGMIGWPFDTASMMDDFLKKVETAVQVPLACFARKASIMKNGAAVAQWTPPSPDQVLSASKTGGKLPWAKAVAASDISQGGYTLAVDRCCYKVATKMETDKFMNCDQSMTDSYILQNNNGTVAAVPTTTGPSTAPTPTTPAPSTGSPPPTETTTTP